MLKLYVAPSSASSRKAKKWLTEENIPFIKRNINNKPLAPSEIKHLIQLAQKLSENGCIDLISTRSNVYHVLTRKLHTQLEDLPMSRFINLMSRYPNLLRRPIIFNSKKMEIGYNRDEIRKFLPRSFREKELHHLQSKLDVNFGL